jgi:riboflavin synthase
MFTGIVEEVGHVVASSGTALTVECDLVLGDLKLGDSLAIDGTCLTTIRIEGRRVTVGLQPETIRRTTLGRARPGQRVNLERALTPTSRLGGHFVQGHVDGTGRVDSVEREADARVIRFSAARGLTRYVVEKGFVAVDGVSLTVVEAAGEQFTVSLVTYTQSATALLDKRPGEMVNIEVDILAKYVERFVGERGEAAAGDGDSLTVEFLAEHGFA